MQMRTFWRWAFWPAIVVLALNIETFASRIGADQWLTWVVARGSPMLSGLASALFSDAALHVALLVTGGGVVAWSDWLRRRLPGWSLNDHWRLAFLCRNGADILERSRHVTDAKEIADNQKVIDELRRWLAEQKDIKVPHFDASRPLDLSRAALLFRSIAPAIRAGQIDLAKKVAGAVARHRQDEESWPRSPLGTEPEKQP